MATSTSSRIRRAGLLVCLTAALGTFARATSAPGPRYQDDPIAREPESRDAAKAQPYDIGSL